jgi:hypothetical protein
VELDAEGIGVRPCSLRALAEEAPVSYKDVDDVVTTRTRAGPSAGRWVGFGGVESPASSSSRCSLACGVSKLDQDP